MQKMPDKTLASNTISSYRKRQQRGPLLVGGLAVLLILVGIVIITLLLTNPGGTSLSLFASKTPTPTVTFTPSLTPFPSETPTITPTPTETATPTASAPFLYIVQEGDSLASIAEKFDLGENGILLILALNPNIPASGIIFVGQEILVPNPDMQLPTMTPIPADLPRGTRITYTVQPGDNLAVIAARFNSTVEDIVNENDLANPNDIFVGQQLVIRVNLVTPVATSTPPPVTFTPTP
jgi:LysM repeat protein